METSVVNYAGLSQFISAVFIVSIFAWMFTVFFMAARKIRKHEKETFIPTRTKKKRRNHEVL